MNSITEKAYGKLNLSLDVCGRRTDGYHLVRMIMQTVNIFDTVILTKNEGQDIILTTDSGRIPAGPDNLVVRAAQVMRREYHISSGLDIHLSKRIPIAAGMAGGSADAAAVFRGMNRLFSAGASAKRLRELALPLGADIPYCISGGTQLCEGIGEILTPVPGMPDCGLIVVKPDLDVSTGWVYKAFDSIPEDELHHPDVGGMADAIRRGDLPGIAGRLGNVLEQKTGAEYPVIGELENFLLQHGAMGSIMTGSGPTVFALFDGKAAAHETFLALSAVPAYMSFRKFETEFTCQMPAAES